MTKGAGEAPSLTELDEWSLAKVLLLLPPPLGLMQQTDDHGASQVVASLSLQTDEVGFVEFQTAIDALVKRSFEGLEMPAMGASASAAPPEPPAATVPVAANEHCFARDHNVKQVLSSADAMAATLLPPPALHTDYSSFYSPSGLERPGPPSTPLVATPSRRLLKRDIAGKAPMHPVAQLPPRLPAPPPLPGGWHAVASNTGTYYYHETTRQTTWKLPLE